ncbi:MAG: outer membrane protein assembly factor BamB [Lentimonas sp.]|jgi:outer membrane protein assembly factor BamB
MKNIALALIAISLLASCSSKNKIDDAGSVSVFLIKREIKVDDSLSKVKITLPKQKNSQSWLGSNVDQIENFSFANKISKVNSFKIGKQSGYDYNQVFQPVINDGKIYNLDTKGNLFARELSTNKEIWHRKIIAGWFTSNFNNGKISYLDGKIFATNGNNLVFCFEAETGYLLWRKKISGVPISTPISDGNQVFLVTSDNKTYALSQEDGKINWVHSGILKITGILGAANPIPYEGYLISAYSSGEIYALSKNNGEAGWVFDLNISKAANSDFILNDVDASPIVKDGVVYAVGNGGLMMAIRIKDGVTLWQNELASISDFWLAGNFIYLVNSDNKLISMHKKSGKIKWISQLKEYSGSKKPKNKIIYYGIVMAGNNLIMTNSNNELLLISPFDGEIVQKKKLSGDAFSSPIVVDGKIYLHLLGRFFGTKLLVIQ